MADATDVSLPHICAPLISAPPPKIALVNLISPSYPQFGTRFESTQLAYERSEVLCVCFSFSFGLAVDERAMSERAMSTKKKNQNVAVVQSLHGGLTCGVWCM